MWIESDCSEMCNISLQGQKLSPGSNFLLTFQPLSSFSWSNIPPQNRKRHVKIRGQSDFWKNHRSEWFFSEVLQMSKVKEAFSFDLSLSSGIVCPCVKTTLYSFYRILKFLFIISVQIDVYVTDKKRLLWWKLLCWKHCLLWVQVIWCKQLRLYSLNQVWTQLNNPGLHGILVPRVHKGILERNELIHSWADFVLVE